MKIKKEIKATEEDIESLEMHSVINIISVISSQLQLMQMDSDHPELLDPAIKKASEFGDAAHSKNKSFFNEESLQEFEELIKESVNNLRKDQPVLNDGTAVDEYLKIFGNVFDVFEVRLKEIINRWEAPNKWVPFKVENFVNDFKEFFYAMEKNSKGRYHIIYNIAEQEDKDYLVNFAINSEGNDIIYMPLILKDVIRDLIANARKYTPPGGEITIGISQKEKVFKFVVEDTGLGIPKNEIEQVVEYGYRGSNVKDVVRTMGGGFGLTKAYHVIRELNGELWIESEKGEGTKITVEIPIPDRVKI
ncbi:sensor histidine kinase [Gracilimonas sp.]|uniref:sensor histidine kinase n=1 Tax=Gracilimonas sp. TaxID=1974203 RepID=UPI0028714C73|nr:ATP-binding protein [Gracilimonas sp.]